MECGKLLTSLSAKIPASLFKLLFDQFQIGIAISVGTGVQKSFESNYYIVNPPNPLKIIQIKCKYCLIVNI